MTRVPSTDVLKLEVADDPDGLANLVPNPNGVLGGWGWVTPTANTAMSGDPDGGGLTYTSNAVGVQNYQTEAMPVPALYYVATSWRLITSSPPPAQGLWVQTFWQWLNALGAVISSTPPGTWIDTTLAANRGHTMVYGPNQAPAGAVKVRLVFSVARANDGSAITASPFSVTFDQVTVAAAATAGELGSMRQNLVPDPSFEASPITTNWQPSGTGVANTRDTTQHWDGAASCRLETTAYAIRINYCMNPSFISSLDSWGPVNAHTTITRETGAAAYDGASVRLSGDSTATDVVLQGLPNNRVPVTPGDRVGVRASFRIGNAGGDFTAGTLAQVVGWWCDASGAVLPGSSRFVLAQVTKGAADQGVWFVDSPLTNTYTVPTTVTVSGGNAVPAYFRPGIRFQTGINIRSNMAAYADRILIELNPTGGGPDPALEGGELRSGVAGPYFDGSFTSTPTVQYTWTGGGGSTNSTTWSQERTTVGTSASPGVRTLAQFAVRGGRDYTVSCVFSSSWTGAPTRGIYAQLDWFDGSHNPISPASTVVQLGSTGIAGWVRRPGTVTSPPSALFARVSIYADTIGPGEQVWVDAVQVEAGTTMGTFIIGQSTTAGLPYIPPVSWVDILGATHDITVTRQSLNVGTMVATVLDANLDPSRDDLLHPGRAVRLMALAYGTLPGGADNWQPLFTGTISQSEVTYDPQIPAPRRAHITMSATDALATLANIARDEGVGTVRELAYVLEGCGVPWDLNGSGNQVPTATVVARNDSTSALDQVAITRDSVQGFAWLDRNGTLHVYDDQGSYVGVVTMLDEGVYSGIDISYNTSAVINEVNLSYQRMNPSTLDTEEVPYGPYVDANSVAEWGAFSADFKVQGVPETTSALQAWAQAVLDANATPVRRINSMTVPITKPEHIDPGRGLLDLENLTGTQNLAADLTDNLRIQSLEHHITTTTWVMTVGFGVDGQVASPTFTPAPGQTGGQTIGELLRPVGEVTMFYGAKSAIPAGWLALDGSTFSSTTYPKLFTLLGTTTLPNMADQFPVGAGTKALGTTGGAPTHAHPLSDAAQAELNMSTSPGTLVARVVTSSWTDNRRWTGMTGSAGSAAANTAGAALTGNTDTASSLPPWRSLWFIIRAA
jgi:microcystin-dependent protein